MRAAENLAKCHGLNKSGIVSWAWALVLVATIWGCAPQPTTTPEEQAAAFMAEHSKGAIDGSATKAKPEAAAPDQLPVRYQNPSYTLRQEIGAGSSSSADLAVPVGVKIAPSGPQPLRLVMQELAKLKSMNISWASDVAQEELVHVTIMPEEDFFQAIDNVLRQLDYFHEMEGNTIVIKHKETKKFHIAIPFMSSTYSTKVGGDVLGDTQGTSMSGTLNLDSTANKFDVWGNIEGNLNKILAIWTVPVPEVDIKKSAEAKSATSGKVGTTDRNGNVVGSANINVKGKAASESSVSGAGLESEAQTALKGDIIKSNLLAAQGGKGYFTIDKPIGLVTVTAPRSLMVKIESYLNNLKGEIYRQVSIEAKIIEVTLSSDNTSGLDWSALSSVVGLKFDFSGVSMATGGTLNTSQDQTLLTLDPSNFTVLIDAMKKQGHVEVLSNPKLSVMNGQPAMISVGESVTYVKEVSATENATTGNITYSITPDSVMSGLGMGVIATIMDNDEIVLNLTPVTSSLTQPVEYKTIGANQLGLPKVNLREMSTMVRVKNGEMLVVGGLTDTTATYNNDYVTGLGEVPGPAGKLFKRDGTNSAKKELVILLRPKIIAF